MPDGPSWDDLNARRMELEVRRDDLMQESTAVEEVTQTNASVKELRAMLDSTGGDIGDLREQADEYADQLEGLGSQIREALEDPSVSQLREGIDEGLEEFTDALEAVDGALEPLENALDRLQEALETAEAPADAQIEALAELFAEAVDKLAPLIERIPGLGAFFRIYAEAIRRIAGSVGQIQGTQRALQEAWGQLDLGTTMYMHARNPHEINQAAIREVELEIEQVVGQMIGIAQDQRDAIPEDQTHEVDILVQAAESRCAESRPATNAPELRERNDAWRDLEEAERRRTAAQTDYEAAVEEAARAEIALEVGSRRGGSGANVPQLETDAGATARARDRALDALREREADFDTARAAFDAARAPWDAMRQGYIDCVREQINGLGTHANQGAGLTPEDREYLRVMYPDYSGPVTAPVAPATTPVEVSAAPSSGANRRMVMMGGGVGIFAVAMIGIVLVFSGGDDNGATNGSGSSGGTGTSSGSSSGSSGSSSSGGSSSSSGGSSAIPDAPVIVNACDVFTAAEVSAMFGKTLIADSSANDRRSICTFRRPEDAGGIHVEVQRNSSAAGFLEEYRRQ